MKTPMRITTIESFNDSNHTNGFRKSTGFLSRNIKRMISRKSIKIDNSFSIDIKEYKREPKPLSKMRSSSSNEIHSNVSEKQNLTGPFYTESPVKRTLKRQNTLLTHLQKNNSPPYNFQVQGQNLSTEKKIAFKYEDIAKFSKSIELNYTKYFDDLNASQITEIYTQDIVDYLRFTLPNKQY